VLPALFILGEFTYVRLAANTIENLLALQQIQRIRGYYRGLVPEAEQFFEARRQMRGWRRRWPPPACGRRGSRSCSRRPA
jgi:hypothetical protein